MQALLEAFTPDRCMWGSDWPFLRAPERIDYGLVLALLERLIPDPGDRRKVLWDTPMRLFGFDDQKYDGAVRVGHDGPVDSRTTSWVGITIGLSGRLTIRPCTKSTSVRPACSTSLWTVVNDGWQKSAPKMSSWPTTLIAPGTSTFSAVTAAESNCEQVVERYQSGCAAADSDIGSRGSLVERRHEWTEAGDLDTQSRSVFGKRAPTLGVGP